MAMIVSCPSCATTYRLAEGEEPADGELIRCAGCGHSWLEASARETNATTTSAENLTAAHQAFAEEAVAAKSAENEEDMTEDGVASLLLPVSPEPSHGIGAPETLSDHAIDDEAALLAREALIAESARRERLAARRREKLRWAALALFLVVFGGLLWSRPDEVSRQLPGMARLYEMAGIHVNPRGFEVDAVEAVRTTTTGGDRVLTVRGSLRNVLKDPQKAPTLRFVLRDAKGGALHAWELKAVSTRPAPAGRPVEFVTRLADPPAEAVRVEVRLLPQA